MFAAHKIKEYVSYNSTNLHIDNLHTYYSMNILKYKLLYCLMFKELKLKEKEKKKDQLKNTLKHYKKKKNI